MSGVVAIGLAALTTAALPQSKPVNYPTKPIRLIAGVFASPTDTIARQLAPRMSESWGQPVIVENRAGAGGIVAANILAKATPDGYTLLLISAQFVISAALHDKLPFDPYKDFAGVTQIGFSTSALYVNPSLGVKTLKDFITLARSKPGGLLFSTGGGGSSTHLNAERFNYAAGIKATHVAFKGTPDALLEVLAGRTHYCIVGLGPGLPMIRDGRLIALAVSTPNRSPLLPDVPAIPEVVPGFGRDGSHHLIAPAGTPKSVLDKISKEVARIFSLPEMKKWADANAFHPGPTTPDEHDKLIREQIKIFTEIGTRVGLRK
jgi:tripartite-type tricarboxylate transporter receptor subunit TctC